MGRRGLSERRIKVSVGEKNLIRRTSGWLETRAGGAATGSMDSLNCIRRKIVEVLEGRSTRAPSPEVSSDDRTSSRPRRG